MRLSKRVRWLEHAPIAFTSGCLYFECTMKSGMIQYARIVGKQRKYWMQYIINHTNATFVEEVLSA